MRMASVTLMIRLKWDTFGHIWTLDTVQFALGQAKDVDFLKKEEISTYILII